MSIKYWYSGTDADIPTVAAPAVLAGGEGDFGLDFLRAKPPVVSRLDPWIGEQGERPTPVETLPSDDGDVLALLRAPVVPPVTRAPWTPDQDDLPLIQAVDDGGWIPFFTNGTSGLVLVEPSSWDDDVILPADQPQAPPNEDWAIFPLIGVPVAPVPISFAPTYWQLDEFLPLPPIDEEWYDLPLIGLPVANPAPQRPSDWSWINDLVPTPEAAPADEVPGLLDVLLAVKPPVYSIYDRFVWEMDQGTPVLVAPTAHVVSTPRRLILLDYVSRVLLRLSSSEGVPVAQPLIFTAGETGPYSFAFAGSNGARQDYTGALSVTLTVQNANGGTPIVDAVALTRTSPSDGVATWEPTALQVSTPGDYRAQAKAVLVDGTVVFFPDANPSLGFPITILAAVGS